MDARLKFPEGKIKENSFYGVGWGFGYDEGKKTETYLSMWQW